jgi:hypothetical protein
VQAADEEGRVRARAFLAIAAAALAVAAVAAASSRGANPANAPVLLGKPIEAPRYDYGRRCLSRPQPGTVALERWLGRHFRGVSWGIMRCERLSGRSFSLHSEGRALDWHLDAGNPRQRRAATNLISMLLASDRRGNATALARRMGVQGLIFNCRSWWAGGSGLEPYDYCFGPNGRRKRHLDRTQAHRDHVHIELNWAGARNRTSFWRSPLANR